MRSFGECSFLEDSRYASQLIFMASKPAFVSEAQRSASATSDALQTPISGLPEIGAQMCASRASPTCVDRYAPVSR
jgi:hypothetical protein